MERETTKNGRGADTGRTAQKRNYQRELDKVIEGLEREGKRLRLLLHSCCAPCSSYVLEYLSRYFAITLFYFNPNIYPPQEYQERIGEQERLIREMECAGALGIPVEFQGEKCTGGGSWAGCGQNNYRCDHIVEPESLQHQ